MAIGNNSFASQVRKTHLYVDKLLDAVSKLPAQHRPEAALQAHVLASKTGELSRKLKSAEILGGHYTHETRTVRKKTHTRKRTSRGTHRR